MPEIKHTPGPWEFLGNPEEEQCRVRQTASVRMGDGYYVEHTICLEVSTTANAKLIAAAPELLEALLEAAEIFQGLGVQGGSRTALEQAAQMRAVITKATA